MSRGRLNVRGAEAFSLGGKGDRDARAVAGRARRIAVLVDHDYAETQAFVREPIAQLAAEGYRIDLLAPTPELWTPIDGVRYLEHAGFRARSRNGLTRFGGLAARGLLGRDYALVMATPVRSLVLGALLAMVGRAPLVVMSDELYTRRDWCPFPRWRRAMYWAHARAALTIITDLRRLPALVADCPRLARQSVIELANCPAGTPTTAQRATTRARLGVAEDAVLVLNAGTLMRQMATAQLMETLPHLPPRVVLVMHAAIRRGGLDYPELLSLLEAQYPVRFQLEPLPYDRVDEIVTACDIGVAFYTESGPNFELVGKGSGKLSRYLRAGKPVVVDRRAGLEWVADYGAGIAVDRPADLPCAIERLRADYAAYSQRATECYAEHLAFERYWPTVHAALAKLMG